MNRPEIYLDHAATTPVAGEVLAAMLPHLGADFGNPSSVHGVGQRARHAVDEARDRVAAALGCAQGEVVFTSGGSEADNLALRGVLDRWGSRGRHMVVSALEHDAVLKTAEALADAGRAELTVVGCDPGGVVDPEEVAAAVRPDTVLVSLMLANNEVGTVQEVARAAELVKRGNRDTLVHTDAVQALGKLGVDTAALGVDLLSVSAHKVYGPKSVGALVVRHGTLIAAQITGGGHERDRRAGTENVAGIAGFGVAATLVTAEREAQMARQRVLRDRLVAAVRAAVPDAVVTGADEVKLPSFATFAFPGLRTDVLLTALDGEGVCASGGSACSSGASMPSHVLVAMGLPRQLSAGALRCTLGRGTTAEDIDAAGAVIAACIARMREASGQGRRAAAGDLRL